MQWPSWWLLLAYIGTNCAYADEKYNAIHRDGSFEFNYDTPDAFHVANGDRNNVVRGEFGGRNPKTGKKKNNHVKLEKKMNLIKTNLL